MTSKGQAMRVFLAVTAFTGIVATISLIGSAQGAKPGAPTTREQELAPGWAPGVMLTLSSKGMRFASTRAKANGKWIVQLDGVESPEYDEVLKTVPTPQISYGPGGDVLTYSIGVQGPVAFSADGRRYAYAARTGMDAVVILDGKEIFRGRQSQVAPPVQTMQFTPDSRHLYFFSASGDTLNSKVLMMDGKPVSPPVNEITPLLFSADGSHWVFNAGSAKQPRDRVMVIDGKLAPYSCENARISADGLHVACVTRTAPGMKTAVAVLVDGKLTVGGSRINTLKFSPSGDVFVTATDVTNIATLYRNGVAIPNSVGVTGVLFSADGRHYGARGNTKYVQHWMIIDGKRQKDYKDLMDIVFSPDGTTWAYNAQTELGWQAVVNGEEREPNAWARGGPIFANTGNRYIYAAGPNTTKFYYNGRASAPHHSVWGAAISPDGMRYGYYAGIDTLTTELIIDGEAKTRRGQYDFAQRIHFSPDSKHVVATAMHPVGKFPTLYIDGVYLPRTYTTWVPWEITPDSQHVISMGPATTEQNAPAATYYLDGDPVARCSQRNMTWFNSPKHVRPVMQVAQWGNEKFGPNANQNMRAPDATDWEMQPDGSIIFICATPGPAGYGPIKKWTVMPAPGSNLTSWVASLPK